MRDGGIIGLSPSQISDQFTEIDNRVYKALVDLYWTVRASFEEDLAGVGRDKILAKISDVRKEADRVAQAISASSDDNEKDP